ncbi:MAG: hypothetical protein PVF83_19365, partial [Anaerolineales bacterium]
FSKIKKSDYQQEDYRGLTLEAAIDVVISMVSGIPEIEESKRISVMRKITDAGRTFSNNFFNRFPRIKQAAKYLLEGE